VYADVVEDSLDNINSSIADSDLANMVNQKKAEADSLQSQIDYYNEKETITKEEEEELNKIRDQLHQANFQAEQYEYIQRTMKAEQFKTEISDISSKTNNEIIDLAQERFDEHLKILEDETAAEKMEIIQRHVEAGTIHSQAYRDELQAVDDHYVEKREKLHTEFGEELKVVQEALEERGLVYDEELGKIITLEEDHRKESHKRWAGYVSTMNEDGANIGRAAWQGMVDGLEEGEEPVEGAAKAVAGRARGALTEAEGDFEEAGYSWMGSVADGIRAMKDKVIDEARSVAAAVNAAYNAELKSGVNTPPPKSETPAGSYTLGTQPTWHQMFDSGGVVAGPLGKPQLALVHGGETILPTHKNSLSDNVSQNININATYYVSSKETAEYANRDLVSKFQSRGIGGAYR